MAGILVELIISWLLLWFISKKHLSVLGFKPTAERLTHLIFGFFMAAFCCTVYQLLSTLTVSNSWVLAKQLTAGAIAESTRWVFVSVLYEEFIFRGALLYIAIQKIGVHKACILSAVCFGVYHWFSYNSFGHPVMMLITFLMTGIVGLSWAYAFAKTKAMYLPVGLHFGWNLLQMVVFTNGSSMHSLFVKANEHQLQGFASFMVFLFQVLALPLLTFWYLNRLSNKQLE